MPKGSRTLQQVNNSNSKYDLASANVNHIFEDKDHNLWVSCYKKGLYQLNQGKMAFSTWKFAAQNFVLGSSVSSGAPAADAGFVLQSDVFKGHTLRRKVDEKASSENGYEVLVDTNNSSNDFYESEIQSLHP